MYWLSYSSHTSHHPSQIPCVPWISYATQKLMLNLCKIVPSQSIVTFSSLKQNFIAYRSSKVSDCIFENHQLWQSGFSRVYFNCCWNCSFEPEIITIGQSSHKKYSNNKLNFQVSTKILNAYRKKVWKLIVCTSYLADSKLENKKRNMNTDQNIFQSKWSELISKCRYENKYLQSQMRSTHSKE